MLDFVYAPKKLVPGTRVSYPYHGEFVDGRYQQYFVQGTVLEQQKGLVDTKVRFDETPTWEVRYPVRKWLFFSKEVVERHQLEQERWVSSHRLDVI